MTSTTVSAPITGTALLPGLLQDQNAIIQGMLKQSTDQAQEIELRQKVAKQTYTDILGEVANHHSIPVMDREVGRFIQRVPHGGTILDVGGCWGWHWRQAVHQRPDLKIYILDLVKENLNYARDLLFPYIDKNIFLVHGDANHLPLQNGSIDGYWSVQTLQHIEKVSQAFAEAKRVLKPGGQFACYFRNYSRFFQALQALRRRPYHVEGTVDGQFFFSRGRAKHRELLAELFQCPVTTRFSEVIFTAGRGGFGKPQSKWGQLDSWLSGSFPPWAAVARQRSFHLIKPSPKALT